MIFTDGTSALAVPPTLTRLATQQADVLTRRQLAALGFDRGAVRHLVGTKRWQQLGRSVVVLHNSALSREQRQWAAVLMLDQPAGLAGATAAEVAGLRGFEDEQVHVVVHRSCSANLPAWVRIHNSRRFDRQDIGRRSGIPRVGTGRAIIDAATWSKRPRRACAILCGGVQQRLTTAAELTRELRQAGAVRHVAIMRSILGDISGGGHTLAEIDLTPLAVQAGLRPPRRQAPRREPGGRVRYVDAEFDLADGRRLVVEIDGSVHLKPVQWWADLERQNELVIGGDLVLRFDSLTLRLSPHRVVDQLRRIRRAHER